MLAVNWTVIGTVDLMALTKESDASGCIRAGRGHDFLNSYV